MNPENYFVEGEGKRLYRKSDWPQHWYSWKEFAAHKNPNLFNLPTLSNKAQCIKFTVKIGFKCVHGKVKEFLQDYLTYLKQAKGP